MFILKQLELKTSVKLVIFLKSRINKLLIQMSFLEKLFVTLFVG